MIVETLDPEKPAASAEWDAFVDAHPESTVYHLAGWRAVAERAYGLRAPHLVARDRPGGPVRGVLPLFVVGTPLNRYLTNGLFGAYGALLAEGPEPRAALLEEARRLTVAHGARYLTMKQLGDEPLPAPFERRDLGVVALLPLRPDPDAMWKGFRDKIRNCVRKAQKASLEPRAGHDQLAPFYDVLAENMHRKGTPIYGFAVMRELLAALGARAEVVTLWKGGEAISGALVLEHGGTTYVPFASSRAAHFKLSPNNLLYWEIIRRACLRGSRVLDFGRSPNDSSTLAFKLGWGATTTPQPYFIYTARGKPPALDVHSSSVQRLIELWQRVPRPLADALGPSIYKRFLV